MTTLPYFTIGHGPPLFHHSRVNIGTLAAERERGLSPPVVALECETLPTTLAYRRRRTNVLVLRSIFPMPFSPSPTTRIAHLRHLMHSSTAARSLDLRSADGSRSMRKKGRRIDTRIGRPDTISNRCHVAPMHDSGVSSQTSVSRAQCSAYGRMQFPDRVAARRIAQTRRKTPSSTPASIGSHEPTRGPWATDWSGVPCHAQGRRPSGASTQSVPLVAVRLGGHCRPRVASAGGSKHGDEWLRMRGTLHRRVAPFSRNAAGNPRRSHAMRPSSPTRGVVLTEQPTPAARLGGPKTRLSSRKGLDALAKPTLHWLPL